MIPPQPSHSPLGSHPAWSGKVIHLADVVNRDMAHAEAMTIILQPKQAIMSAPIPRRGSHPLTAARQAAARLRRLAAALAALTCALLASAAIVPAAWAVNVIPLGGGGTTPAPPVPVIAGGMTGWQITLIALGAALVAATAAVLLDRALAARRAASATTA